MSAMEMEFGMAGMVHGAPPSAPASPPAPDPPAAPRTWAEAYPPRPKPDTAPYGFLAAGGGEVASSLGTMTHMIRTSPAPPLVWAPETEGMVPPWEVPWVLEAMRTYRADEYARGNFRTALVVSGMIFLLLWWFLHLGVAIICLVVLVPWLLVVHGRVAKARKHTPAQFQAEADAAVQASVDYVDHLRIASADVPFTNAIGAAIIATCVLQLITLDTAGRVAALDPVAVRAGEVWRLLTGPLLHGHPLHIAMNLSALLGLGRHMEARGPRGWVPLVFVVSALAGGMASVALPPDVPSVGASGGLMGMLGFLLVMAYRRRSVMPRGFLKALLRDVVVVAVMGIVAYQLIDNAAHAGGLVAGVLLGVAVVPSVEHAPEWGAGRGVDLAGRGAIALLWMGVVLIAAVCLGTIT